MSDEPFDWEWEKTKRRVWASVDPANKPLPLHERIYRSFLSDEQRMKIREEEHLQALDAYHAALKAEVEARQAARQATQPPPFNLYEVPLQTRYEHTHILAAPGSGKTQLIQSMVLADLERENKPTVVVVDSQGDMIKKLLALDLPYDPLYITPKDPPSINVFDVKGGEAAIAAAIETLEYLFAGFGVDMSGKMRTLFKPMCRLMFSFDATLLDVIKFLDKPAAYKTQIDQLPVVLKEFFYSKLLSTSAVYKTTKDDIGYRVEGLVGAPTFQKLLTSRTTTIDFYEALNSRRLILIDTDQAYLGADSSIFGRFFISLILRAALERERIPEHFRTPAFLYVDEAQEYFDQKTEHLLTQARKYKLGAVFSHHRLNQCKGTLREALLMASTKLVCRPTADDGLTLEREVGLDKKGYRDLHWHMSQRKFLFTCFVRDLAFYQHVQVQYGVLENKPQRKDIDALMARNAARMRSGRIEKPERKIAKGVDSYGEDA